MFAYRTDKNDDFFKDRGIDKPDIIFLNSKHYWCFRSIDNSTIEGYVRSIKSQIIGEDKNECIICYDEIMSDSPRRICHNCGTMYCYTCMLRLLSKEDTVLCQVCKGCVIYTINN